jgi:subtilisin family serine protease
MKAIVAAILLSYPALGCAHMVPVVGDHFPPMKPVTIAVIDTGFGAFESADEKFHAKLCKTGHRDFTNSQEFITIKGVDDPVPKDNHGHGSNIAGVIQTNAEPSRVPFCMVILKYFDPKAKGNDNLKNTVKAIDWARENKINIINYSGGGVDRNEDEVAAVKAYIDAGGIFVAAAGNERSLLKVAPYYPAMDDSRVIVVGSKVEEPDFVKKNEESLKKLVVRGPARIDEFEYTEESHFLFITTKQQKVNTLHREVMLDKNKNLVLVSRFSNYGRRVNRWENGEEVYSFGLMMSGTSQAAAIVTGKIVGERFHE